jgi:segregation and condensation protein A
MPTLLELVGERKIAVDELPLAQVTQQFSTYLQTVDEVDLGSAGEFLAAAARLMLLKSGALLPHFMPAEGPNDETSDTGLAESHGEAVRHAAAALGERQGAESFPPSTRPELMERPIEPRSPTLLRHVWDDMCKRAAADVIRVSTPAFVRLEAALSRLIRDLKSGATLSFRRMLRGSNRHDVAIHFIAALELVRRRQATAEQPELFGDITLARADTDLGTRCRAG